MSDTQQPADLFDKLNERKFFQLFGSYLAVGFGLLQFLEFLVQRYGIDSDYIDRYLVLWLVSVPAVAILIYYRGRLPRKGDKGRRSWQRWVVPLNLVISGILAVILFGGSEVKAEADVVTTTDESGQTVAAVVPQAKQVKYVTVFAFDNADGKEDSAWWSEAISYLLSLDLRQRPDVYPTQSLSLMSKYEKLGLKPFSHIGVAAQRKIAQEARTQYFVTGKYSIDAQGVYRLEGSVQSTKDGKKMFDLLAEDTDPLAAIEQIGSQIIDGLPDPIRTDEKTTDLPVSALVTDQVPALKNLMLGTMTLVRNPQQTQEALALFRRSSAADPNCAICKFLVGNMLLSLEKRDSAILLTQQAVRMSATLPQREQIGVKSLLYSIQGDMDKYYALQEMGRKLFPYDYTYYSTLLSYYKGTKGDEAGIELMREAVENGHEERGLLVLADLYSSNKEFDKAKATLDRFFDSYPDRTEDRLLYVSLYEKQNEFGRARETLEELTTLDPFNLSYKFKLNDILLREGKEDQALSGYEDLLSESMTYEDSLRAYRSRAAVYLRRGEVKRALESYDMAETLMLNHTVRPNVIIGNLNYKIDPYLSIGQGNRVDEIIEEISRFAPEVAEIFSCAKLRVIVEKGYEERSLAREVRECRDVATSQGMTPEAIDFYEAYADKDYERAASMLDNASESQVVLTSSDRFKIQVYLQADRKDKAKEILDAAIAERGEIATYLVQRYQITGDRADLDRALEIWENADPEYIPAAHARKLAGAQVQ